MKMRKDTEKAITQIPKELNKLSRVIAVIGETLFNKKIDELHSNKIKFKELMEKEQSRRGVT